MDQLYTTQEAGPLLGITRHAVTALVSRGLLTSVRHGRFHLIPASEVERYQRERRPIGAPGGPPVQWRGGHRTGSLAERFWRKVDKSGDCWLWTAGTQRGGYGKLRVGKKGSPNRRASRLAWELATGETLTPQQKICHICDNTACVRNDDAGTYQVDGVEYPRRGHLFRGDALSNQRDRVQKGRHFPGAQNHQAKLTEAQVLVARARYLAGGITQRALAAELGVSHGTLGPILQGKRWTHV